MTSLPSPMWGPGLSGPHDSPGHGEPLGGRAPGLDGRVRARREPLEVLHHAVERLDVTELCVDVEEVPLHDAGHPVADGLADDDWTEAFRDRVLGRVPDTAGHRHAGDDHGVHAVSAEIPREVGAVEGARALL